MKIGIISILAFLFSVTLAQAAGGELSHGTPDAHNFAITLLAVAAILFAAKVLHLIEKIKLPPVVGELVAGIILGNLTIFGFSFFHDIQTNDIIRFLAEFGVIILLFQIGLESNISQLLRVGPTALLVAIIGAVVPFVLGAYVAGPLLLPGQPMVAYLFIGASLAATSVGITARIFKDLGKMKTQAAQVVLGAAVIDDILGLILLAVISSLAISGSITPVSIGLIVLKSFLFLIISVILGQLTAPPLSRLFAMIHTGMGTKFTLAISFALVFASIAELIGLEPIIGAFAAGLVLDPIHFRTFREPHLIEEIKEKLASSSTTTRNKLASVLSRHADKSIEELIEPLAFFFVPIFFVVTGMSVNIVDLLNPTTILLSIAVTIVAIGGKVLAGLPAKRGNKLTVGLAMVPRGEVGLIFAAIGQGLGVITPQIFSVIVLTVLLTTIIGPFLLSQNLQKLAQD